MELEIVADPMQWNPDPRPRRNFMNIDQFIQRKQVSNGLGDSLLSCKISKSKDNMGIDGFPCFQFVKGKTLSSWTFVNFKWRFECNRF